MSRIPLSTPSLNKQFSGRKEETRKEPGIFLLRKIPYTVGTRIRNTHIAFMEYSSPVNKLKPEE